MDEDTMREIKYWYSFVLTLCKSISFMIMGIMSVSVISQASNYTSHIGLQLFIPFMFVSIHYLVMNKIKIKIKIKGERR